MPPPEFPNAPEPTIVVMGDAGSGKSSLIDAAIVDAARRHAMREPPPSSPFHHPLRTGSGRVALPSGRSDIWGRHEIRKVHDLRSVDLVAASLWRRWLGALGPAQRRADRRKPSFSVTALASEVVIGTAPGWPDAISIVEVSSETLLGFPTRQHHAADSPAAFACQRLDFLVGAASVLVFCLPVCRSLPVAALRAVQAVLQAAGDRAGVLPPIHLACTLADVDLSDLTLRLDTNAESLVDAPARRTRALELIGDEAGKQELWASIGKRAIVDLCSSFGVLLSSGTANVDLLLESPQSLGDPNLAMAPLWPSSDCDPSTLNLADLASLGCWAPFGVREALLGG